MRSIEKRVVETARTYHEASRKADSATWEFADTLAEFASEHGEYGWKPAVRNLCLEAEVPVPGDDHLGRLRSSALTWKKILRVDGASWRAHAELDPSYHERMIEFVGANKKLTLNDAIAMKESHQPSRGVTQPPTTQQKVEAVREFMADPEVATAAAADKAVRSSFAKASDDVFDEVHDRQRQKMPAIGRIEDAQAVAEAMVLFSRYRRQLTDVMGALKSESLTEDEREALEEAGTKAKNATDLFLDSLKKRDWDLALAALNGEVE